MRLWHILVTALVAGSLTAAPLAGSTSASGSGSNTAQVQALGASPSFQDNLAADLQVMWQNLLLTFNGSAQARTELVFNFARTEARLAARDFQGGATQAAIVPAEVYARDMTEGQAMLGHDRGAGHSQAVQAESEAAAAGRAMVAAANEQGNRSSATETEGQNPVMASLIAKAAGVPIQAVLALRATGMGWAEIAAHYHLDWSNLVEAYAKAEGSGQSSVSSSGAANGSASSGKGASASSNGSANSNNSVTFGF